MFQQALLEFDSRKKLGGDEFSAKYRDQLVEELAEAYQNYKVGHCYFGVSH